MSKIFEFKSLYNISLAEFAHQVISLLDHTFHGVQLRLHALKSVNHILDCQYLVTRRQEDAPVDLLWRALLLLGHCLYLIELTDLHFCEVAQLFELCDHLAFRVHCHAELVQGL